jgi:hypothetical protein
MVGIGRTRRGVVVRQASLQPDLAMPSALAGSFSRSRRAFVIQADLTAVTSGPLEHASRPSCGCWLIKSHVAVQASIDSAPLPASRLRPGLVGCGRAIVARAPLHDGVRKHSVT